MEDLLNNPAVQGGVIPFIVAFLSAVLLVRVARLYGLAIILGFVSMVMLTTGIQFEPLTSTRKIVLLAIVSPFISLAFEYLRLSPKLVKGIGAVLGLSAVLWLLWPYLQRQELLNMIVVGGGLGIYALVMLFTFLSLKNVSALASAASISAAGFGIGGSALLGASALLGQMGISIGVSSLAIISTLLMARATNNASYIETFSAGLLFALIGSAAVVYAKLEWYVLIVLIAVPVLARIGLSKDQAPWLRAVIWFGICMVPALVAVLLSYRAEGPVPY